MFRFRVSLDKNICIGFDYGGPEVVGVDFGFLSFNKVYSTIAVCIPCILFEKILFCRLLPVSLSVRFCAV